MAFILLLFDGPLVFQYALKKKKKKKGTDRLIERKVGYRECECERFGSLI